MVEAEAVHSFLGVTVFTAIKVASLIVLAADLGPGPKVAVAPPSVQYVEPRTAEPGVVFDESYVIVQGLEGRLLVPEVLMQEMKLQPGDEVTQDEMYRILQRNRVQ